MDALPRRSSRHVDGRLITRPGPAARSVSSKASSELSLACASASRALGIHRSGGLGARPVTIWRTCHPVEQHAMLSREHLASSEQSLACASVARTPHPPKRRTGCSARDHMAHLPSGRTARNAQAENIWRPANSRSRAHRLRALGIRRSGGLGARPVTIWRTCHPVEQHAMLSREHLASSGGGCPASRSARDHMAHLPSGGPARKLSREHLVSSGGGCPASRLDRDHAAHLAFGGAAGAVTRLWATSMR